MHDQLCAIIDSYQEQILADLKEFVAIPSVSYDLAAVRDALDYALALGRRLGFDARDLLDKQVGEIEMRDPVHLPDQHETLGILTHVDVVPPGEPADWDTDPFTLTIRDGRAHGRGSLDDKGMAIASLYAMKAVQELGLPMYKKVRLILGTQEEVEWTDMDAYVARYPLPDYGFTPDGEYPICNIEKGCMDIELRFDVSGQRLGQRPQVTACKIGVSTNTVPGKASCSLSDGTTVEAAGKAVHACQPEQGENALFALADRLSALDLEENRLSALIHAIRRDLSDCYGGAVDLYSESETYRGEYVHRNAFAPTMLTSDGNTASLNINLRFPYGADPEEIVAKFAQWAAPLGGQVEAVYSMPAVFVPKTKPYLQAFAAAYEEVTGLKNEFTLAYGGSYAKAMPNIVSWGPIFPGEEDTCHEPNEYITIDSLIKSAKVFAVSIAEIVTTRDDLK